MNSHVSVVRNIRTSVCLQWKNAILLDCVMSYLLDKDKSQFECERRKFDQYLALSESVCTVCAQAWSDYCLEAMRTVGTIPPLPEHVRVVSATSPWNDMATLKRHIMVNISRSTPHKRNKLLSCLFDSQPDFELENALDHRLNAVVNKIFRVVGFNWWIKF